MPIFGMKPDYLHFWPQLLRISHYPTISTCAKISVLTRVILNVYTVCTSMQRRERKTGNGQVLGSLRKDNDVIDDSNENVV